MIDCEYLFYFDGCKIPKLDNYPESTWGHYLPGDEPGWYCGVTEELCDEKNCPLEDLMED